MGFSHPAAQARRRGAGSSNVYTLTEVNILTEVNVLTEVNILTEVKSLFHDNFFWMTTTVIVGIVCML